MEILSSGSIVDPEDPENLERLKFTAAALAAAAGESEGFTSENEAARRLAGELWEGLDYTVCETERSTVEGIFIHCFMARLAGLHDPIRPPAGSTPITLSKSPETVSPGCYGAAGTATRFPENNPPLNPAGLSSEAAHEQGREVDPVEDDSAGNPVEPPVAESEEWPEPATDNQKTEPAESVPALPGNTGTAGLDLPDTEPFQWEKCTVTLAIQLLPAGDASPVRRAVISVRSHDFAPEISLVELAAADPAASLTPKIQEALAKFKENLPLKVIDRLKKEKNSAKSAAPKNAGGEQKPHLATGHARAAHDRILTRDLPPAPEQGIQQSLFG